MGETVKEHKVAVMQDDWSRYLMYSMVAILSETLQYWKYAESRLQVLSSLKGNCVKRYANQFE